MRPVARRFLIAYAAAFGLLYGLGFFITGRHIDAHWASLPFDPHRKITRQIDFVNVHLMQSDDGQIIKLENRTMQQFIDGAIEYQDPYGTEGYLGTVHIDQTWQQRVLAPFVWKTQTTLQPYIDIDTEATIPPRLLDRAKSEAYQLARRYLDAPTFYEEQLTFPELNSSFSSNRIVLPQTTRFLIPTWLIPILFATVPLPAAWGFTAITMKRDET